MAATGLPSARHELQRRPDLGLHRLRCAICGQIWALSDMTEAEAGALIFEECPGEPTVVLGLDTDHPVLADPALVTKAYESVFNPPIDLTPGAVNYVKDFTPASLLEHEAAMDDGASTDDEVRKALQLLRDRGLPAAAKELAAYFRKQETELGGDLQDWRKVPTYRNNKETVEIENTVAIPVRLLRALAVSLGL